MWEKYHEEYPNGLKRTSFMCHLDGQFKYKEDLGGLCITCDLYGYQVFDSLTELICNSQLYGARHYNPSCKNCPTLKLNKEVLSAYQKKIKTTFDSF
jgi:hypothetical protein